jgi:hypothetical protein
MRYVVLSSLKAGVAGVLTHPSFCYELCRKIVTLDRSDALDEVSTLTVSMVFYFRNVNQSQSRSNDRCEII